MCTSDVFLFKMITEELKILFLRFAHHQQGMDLNKCMFVINKSLEENSEKGLKSSGGNV